MPAVMQVENSGMVWPDNMPLYDVAKQMDFILEPNSDFHAVNEVAKAVEENDQQQVNFFCSCPLINKISRANSSRKFLTISSIPSCSCQIVSKLTALGGTPHSTNCRSTLQLSYFWASICE